jgi:hypothetical protein
MADWTNISKPTSFSRLLMEDGSLLLFEDLGRIVLDQEISAFTNITKN